jgi:hypothetical protein
MKRVVALTVVSFAVFAVGLVLIGSAYAQVGFPQVTGRTRRFPLQACNKTTMPSHPFPAPVNLSPRLSALCPIGE